MRRASLIRLYGKIRCTAAASATPIGARPICQEAGLATLGYLSTVACLKVVRKWGNENCFEAWEPRPWPRSSLELAPAGCIGDNVRRPRSKPDARFAPWLAARNYRLRPVPALAACASCPRHATSGWFCRKWALILPWVLNFCAVFRGRYPLPASLTWGNASALQSFGLELPAKPSRSCRRASCARHAAFKHRRVFLPSSRRLVSSLLYSIP